MTDQEQIVFAAYHEAGHAVMKYNAGVTLAAVSITNDGEGLCEGSGEAMRAEDALRINLAGMVAETRLHGKLTVDQVLERAARWSTEDLLMDQDEEIDIYGYTSDETAFLLTLRQPGFRESWFWSMEEPAAIRRCWDDTGRLVDGYWPAIEAIAQALISEQTISGERIRALIESSIEV